MKKISLLGLGIFAAFAVSAQESLVKDVERELKASSPDYAKALKDIQPALSDASTSGTMMPWYLAGKAGIGVYDNAYIQETMGNALNPEQKIAAGKALIEGCNAYFKALQLDSIPDEKGKIKPKKSKEILKTLASEYPQLRNAGIFMFDAHDYDGAYDAWELYVNLPSNPLLGKQAPQADPDTIVGQIMFYQAVAMLSVDKNQKALDKLQQVIPTGFSSVDVYRYGVESARRVNDSIAMLDFAQKGYDKFGTEDISFIGQLINAKLSANDYPACYELVNKALEVTSEDNAVMKSQLYDILGYILEQDNKLDEAEANFDKAITLDPSFAKGYFDKGRIIYNKALKLDEEGNGEDRNAEVVPDLLKAAELFEKAYMLDENNMRQIPNILYRLYYRLGAGYEDKTDYWKGL